MDLLWEIKAHVNLESDQGPQPLIEELIVSHLPVSVLVLNAAGQVIATTPPDGRGLLRDLPATGRHWSEVIAPALAEAAHLEEQVALAIAEREEVIVPPVDATINGVRRTFRLNFVPVPETTPAARLLLHIEDLTDALERERRLRRAESLEQLGALSAAVAHELRNPVTGIAGALHMVARSLGEDDPRGRIMAQVEDQVRRLDELVRDLLDFATPTRASMEALRLEVVVDELLGSIQGQHPTMCFAWEGAGTAWADPRLVRQVLDILVCNAAEAMGGAGEVHIQVKPGELLISDSGPGIPPEKEEEIFRPFFATRSRGAGLGLAICRKAADAMGGRIGLAAGRLKGAAFQLGLPLLA